MKIQKKLQSVFKLCFQFFHHTLYGHNLRNQHRFFTSKHSVQVFPTKTGTKVTKNNTIRVGHWNYLENYLFSKLLSQRITRNQELEKTFDHVAATSFTRMDPSTDKHTSLKNIRSGRVSDNQKRYFESTKRLASNFFFEDRC